jgi:hypothetical protein
MPGCSVAFEAKDKERKSRGETRRKLGVEERRKAWGKKEKKEREGLGGRTH